MSNGVSDGLDDGWSDTWTVGNDEGKPVEVGESETSLEGTALGKELGWCEWQSTT
jgi:hypothetical protein